MNANDIFQINQYGKNPSVVLTYIDGKKYFAKLAENSTEYYN